MKKFFATILILNFISLNVLAFENAFEDNLVKNLDKNLKIEQYNEVKIVDEFADSTLNPSLVIQPSQQPQIKDEMLKGLKADGKIISEKDLKFDFERLDFKSIKVHPKRYYSTRNSLVEGEYIEFALAQDVEINNQIYKKGSSVKARVETVTKNGAYGVPADFVVDNFVLANNVYLDGNINSTGANRSVWVYPCAYGLSWFFGLGLLFLPIRGGHAKLRPTQIYNLNYAQ